MTNKKGAVIGIPGWKIGDNSFGVTIPYLDFFNQYGRVKILTLHEDVDPTIDLLVIPGGADVDPLRYGAVPHFSTSRPDPIKEYFDAKVLPRYIDNKTPVFGICRGIQTIAVHFGAILVQDMPNHETNDSSKREFGVHNIIITNFNFKRDFTQYNGFKEVLKVNSLHHQCVSNKGFPDCLEVIAVYKGKSDNSSIEAIRHRDLPIMAVQYHPEEMGYDILSDYIIETLISKSKNYA